MGFLKLVGKNVEIKAKAFGNYPISSYRGVVKEIHEREGINFIELDTGEFINLLFVASITIIK